MLAVSEGLTWGCMQPRQGKALAVHEANIFLRVFPLPRPWQLSAGCQNAWNAETRWTLTRLCRAQLAEAI